MRDNQNIYESNVNRYQLLIDDYCMKIRLDLDSNKSLMISLGGAYVLL